MLLKMEDRRQKIRAKGIRPSDFMKARRPYLFSDTEIEAQPTLDRATFEYLLETLTARKQELDFEHFARRLAEKEVCPNLIPQTGPTGGGDSKVDAETYPVSQKSPISGITPTRKGATVLWDDGRSPSAQKKTGGRKSKAI